MIEVAIGDVHSRWEPFRTLLEKIGVITINSGDPMTDVRNDGYRIHQLGDAVSLGYGEIEANFYRYFWHIMGEDDVALLGNHELPAIWHDRSMDFNGVEDHDPEVWEMIRSYWKEDRLRAASSVGDWLLTHAGLAASHQKHYEECSASELAYELDLELYRAIDERIPAQAHGPIAGMFEGSGGIFWARLDRNKYRTDKHMKQVFGHTPSNPDCINNMWRIDTYPTQEFFDKKKAGLPVGKKDWGSCAALVWDNADADPRLVLPYE